MQSTLSIKDLSVHAELDGDALSAVRGGEGNQANGTSQANGQGMAALANVGNASLFCGGPVTIQSDNTFTQDAYNHNDVANVDLALFALRVPTFVR